MRALRWRITVLLWIIWSASALQAGPYYVLDIEDSEIAMPYLLEGTKRFRLRLEGAATAQQRYDSARRSNVLALGAGSTPRGDRIDRAEVQLYGNLTYDKQWFVGLSVFISRDVATPDDWQILLQCHQNGTSLPPPISLDLEPDGRIALVARNEADRFESLWSAPLPRDRWLRIELGLQMGQRGHVQLWINGIRRADIRRPLGWGAGVRACALKTGIYRSASARPFHLLLDDIVLGSTHRDLR